VANSEIDKTPHIPVLLEETLSLFEGIKEGFFVDCTLGYGGHSEALLERYSQIKLIGIDRDIEAINFASKRLAHFGDRVSFKHGSYADVFPTLDHSTISGVLADIGVSSLQLDKRERGFSFLSESLDMRMDQSSDFSAKNVVNEYDEEQLADIIYKYGEDRAGRKLAKLIVDNRPFETAIELSELIKKHHHVPKIHAATRLFQAIRIEVNNELGELETLLSSSKDLKDGAMIGIISFHSLEDRIVKQNFKSWTVKCICPHDVMRCSCGNNHNIGKLLTKKPITASKAELKINARSRSAKLRGFCFEKDSY
jgi:16S rRNA (cytosine1402-N4)-methyltransferase